ncbi:MAG TPA: CDP-alcohol phosphatidyltransferase family protein [Gemmatimonadales bacterium]|nr:CDP-alcohol phosphatidyltransferase family protein [Gemmatimonadales bacterium]
MYASKGPAVEEWADRWFFGPVGWRLANALLPTRISADAVTFVSLVLGVMAGHLMWYASAWINAGGVALFVVSDIFDSADGQLARLRGTSTRLGRILDGLADTGRFVSLYGHLGARLYVSGWGWGGVVLAFAALASHSYQAAGADFIRQAYLHFAVGKGSELDIPEHSAMPRGRRSSRVCTPGFTAITSGARRCSSHGRPRCCAHSRVVGGTSRGRCSAPGQSGSAGSSAAARGSRRIFGSCCLP